MRFLHGCLFFLLTATAARTEGEPFRPLYHFTPAKNWMNDPNGMVWHDGEWHLFYQYNPFGDKWGHMSWGHAVSRDLLRWEHLPVALAEENGVMIFSGSAVMDDGNTSGFGKDGKPPMVAIYTAHTDKNQSQAIAFSTDRGRTFTKYEGNPVLDIGAKDFRDPKVMWHAATGRWIMTIAWPLERKVRFYASPDLKAWTHLSDFGPTGSVAGIWECPDLFPLKIEGGGEKWVLIVNVGSGGPAGGSAGQYFVGEFDGSAFRLDDASLPPGQPAAGPMGMEVLADFEQGYGSWRAEGNCFGGAPATGSIGNQHPVPGFTGKALVNTFLGGDGTTGTLTSPAFSLTKDWLCFQIGGGRQPGKTCVNLRLDGAVVRTATGRDLEALDWVSWSVAELRGRTAMLEIVDQATSGWGHVNADQFVLADSPARPATEAALWLDHGPDFYAGVTWSGGPPGDDRRILLGWMSNWPYANAVPTSPWRSAMTIPRELALRQLGGSYRLVQKPVQEMSQLNAREVRFPGGTLAEANDWLVREKVSGDAMDLTVTLTPSPSGQAALDVLADDTHATAIIANTASGTLRINRSRSGRTDFHPDFSAEAVAPLPAPPEGVITLRVLIDACSVEVFAADGATASTSLVLPTPNASAVRITAAASVGPIIARMLKPRQ